MSVGIVNSIKVDYPLIKYVNDGVSRNVEFHAGFMFPDNKNIQYCIWDFGDSTTLTTSFSSVSATYAACADALAKYTTFFPQWKETNSESVRIPIPKFETSKVYTADGTYTTNCTLVDSKGTSYVGTPVQVTVKASSSQYPQPNDWGSIANEYVYSESAASIFTNGSPQLSAYTPSIDAIPIQATFSVSNILNRVDIDYIEWDFGDGTTSVFSVLGAPILQEYTTIDYAYPLLSNSLIFKTAVTLYTNNFGNKHRIRLVGQDIILQDRRDISVSNIIGGTSLLDQYAFNIYPINTSILPIETSFYCKVAPDLKYIMWDHDDGSYDTIPVSLSPSLSNINQVVEHRHKYNSVNYFKYIPRCIFVYKHADGSYTSEQYNSWSFLNYDLGIANPQANFFTAPVFSPFNYSKFNNIHILADYSNNEVGHARLELRLSLDYSYQLYSFEKIIWSINGETITQDKNTSDTFGHLTLENVKVPYYEFSVNADLYGIPFNFDNTLTSELTYYDSYAFVKDIYTYEDQDALNVYSASIVPLSSELIITQEGIFGGIEIITPIVEQVIGERTTETMVISSRAFTFDKMFDAVSPASNFINRDYPTSASVYNGIYNTHREIGFFRPSKATCIVVDPGRFSFKVNFDNVDIYEPIYFPDPFKYGSSSSALTFNTIDSSFKKCASMGAASNEPNTNDDHVSFHGYTSKKKVNKYEDLSYLYDAGYVHDIKSDIYGNQFGLIKDSGNFKQYVNENSGDTVTTIVFNGYKFINDAFDSFNYLLSGGDGQETIIPGLSTYTNGYTLPGTPYTINFRQFKNYNTGKGIHPIDVSTQYLNPLNVGYRDCGSFVMDATTPLVDTISSDLSAYPSTGSFYYTELYEAAAYTATPYVRPLVDGSFPAITARFTESVRVSGNNGVIDIDCGMFATQFPSENNIVYNGTEVMYISSVNPDAISQYTVGSQSNASIQDRESLNGVIYIKDRSNNVLRFTDALNYTQSKYGSAIFNELSSGVQEFDVSYNTYFIQTSGNLVIDRIAYENDAFVSPRTPNIIVPFGNGQFNPISNRFKLNDTIYFATLTSFNTGSALSVVPYIYKFNSTQFTLTLVYPLSSDAIDDLIVDAGDVLYVEASSPRLTYMAETDIFNISYILKDQNKSPYLISISFNEKDKVGITSVSGFKFAADNYTVQFSTSTNLSVFSTMLSSAPPSLISNGLVL